MPLLGRRHSAVFVLGLAAACAGPRPPAPTSYGLEGSPLPATVERCLHHFLADARVPPLVGTSDSVFRVIHLDLTCGDQWMLRIARTSGGAEVLLVRSEGQRTQRQVPAPQWQRWLELREQARVFALNRVAGADSALRHSYLTLDTAPVWLYEWTDAAGHHAFFTRYVSVGERSALGFLEYLVTGQEPALPVSLVPAN